MTTLTHTDIVCEQIRAQIEREASYGWTPQRITQAAALLSDANFIIERQSEKSPEHRDLTTMRTGAINAAVRAIQLVALLDAQTSQSVSLPLTVESSTDKPIT